MYLQPSLVFPTLEGKQGILTYRGYRIVDLAENSTFEETAYLLLDGELPNAAQLARFDTQLREHRRVKYNIHDIMKSLPVTGRPMEMLQTAVASLGMFYPNNVPVQIRSPDDESEQYVHGQSIRILARMATLVAMWQQLRLGNYPVRPRSDLSYAANFLYMFNGDEPDPLVARIMDVCFILHAEHTINASTFSAMVTGSTLAIAVLRDCGCNWYPRRAVAWWRKRARDCHAGGNWQTGKCEEPWLEKKLAAKETIWGMGHREYKVKDPRATLLQKLMRELAESQGHHQPVVRDSACT